VHDRVEAKAGTLAARIASAPAPACERTGV
jgi:hypothetical protein